MKRNFAEHGYMCDAASLENRIISLGTDFKFPSNVHVSKLYEDANMAVIHTDRTYLFLNGGGYSGKPGKGIECVNTHTHNDALSFELSIDGRDFIVDSGAYLYTSNSEKRNAFRSTLKHNTVFVDGEEQNDFVGFFRMKKNAIYNPLQNKNGVYEGSYVTLRGKMNHRRSFRFFQDRLEVRDIINKDGTNHNVRIIFHFAPGLTPQIDDKIVKANGVSMIFNKTPKHLIVIDDTVSPSFGVLTENKTVVVSFDFDNELEVITKIVY